MKLTEEERKATRSAVKGSIDLYSRYLKVPIEDSKHKAKARRIAKVLPVLKSAHKKLSTITLKAAPERNSA